MSNEQQMELAKTGKGRIELHLRCFLRDKKFKFHIKGIMREIKFA